MDRIYQNDQSKVQDTSKARCRGSKRWPEIWSGDNNEMLEIKNIYTENMFFKEQLMRPGGLAA